MSQRSTVSQRMDDFSASSQGVRRAPNIDDIGFVLATAEEVGNHQLMRDLNVGLAVSVLGQGSQPPVYPPWLPHVNFAVAWQGGREQQLMDCLPQIASALSQGTYVVVHCLYSFSQGPSGLGRDPPLAFRLRAKEGAEIHRQQAKRGSSIQHQRGFGLG